jgi:hypothetical protein
MVMQHFIPISITVLVVSLALIGIYKVANSDNLAGGALVRDVNFEPKGRAALALRVEEEKKKRIEDSEQNKER